MPKAPPGAAHSGGALRDRSFEQPASWGAVQQPHEDLPPLLHRVGCARPGEAMQEGGPSLGQGAQPTYPPNQEAAQDGRGVEKFNNRKATKKIF